MGGLVFGDSNRYNKLINHWLWRQSISLHWDPVGGTWRGGGSLTRDSLGFFLTYIFGFLFLEPADVVNLCCGTEEEAASVV